MIFTTKRRQDLIGKIMELVEAKIRKHEKSNYHKIYIGEYFIPKHVEYVGSGHYPFEKCNSWKKFTQKDVEDEYDGGMKIDNIWFDKKDLIIYDTKDKYEKKRIEIQSRLEADTNICFTLE